MLEDVFLVLVICSGFGSHGSVTRTADGICVSALLLEDEKPFLVFIRGDAILVFSKHISCSLKYLA